MFRIIKPITLQLSLLTLFLSMNGCFKDRQPTNPLQYETRRPDVAYVIPADGDTVSTDSIIVYFDEKMDGATVEDALTVSLVVDNKPWTQLSSVAALAQSQSDPNLLFLSRRERGHKCR